MRTGAELAEKGNCCIQDGGRNLGQFTKAWESETSLWKELQQGQRCEQTWIGKNSETLAEWDDGWLGDSEAPWLKILKDTRWFNVEEKSTANIIGPQKWNNWCASFLWMWQNARGNQRKGGRSQCGVGQLHRLWAWVLECQCVTVEIVIMVRSGLKYKSSHLLIRMQKEKGREISLVRYLQHEGFWGSIPDKQIGLISTWKFSP